MASNGFRDPAFMENRKAPIHRWVPWIAGFSTQFVQDVFEHFLSPPRSRHADIVDPFAGVGTTLVQSMLAGHGAIGYEINPYAALATKIKLAAPYANLDEIASVIVKAKLVCQVNEQPQREPPKGFRSRIPFFSRQVQPQVLRLLDLIDGIPNETTRDIARIAFGSVMVSVSNYSYEPSLSSRPGAKKPLQEEADVASAFAEKLSEMVEDIVWLKKNTPKLNGQTYEVRCKDFLSRNGAEAGCADLVVTSPPYMNNYHYVRNTRPQLYWLSLLTDSSDLRNLERTNFGKSWQAVRDAEQIDLECDHPELTQIVDELRNTRCEAGAYGGPGWANYVVSYFNDCLRFSRALKRVLRRKGTAVIVIGNSIIQGIPIATDRILGELAAGEGLQFRQTISLRTKRVGASITASSVRRGDTSKAILYENAVVLKKR